MGVDSFLRNLSKEGKIGCDTNCFIYYFEAHKKFGPVIKKIFSLLVEGKIQIFCSTILLTELLVGPFRANNEQLIELYSSLTKRKGLFLIPVSEVIATCAAKLRATYNLKTPDTIHLATAIESGAKIFLTNDERAKKVREIKVCLVQDLV